MPPTIDMPTIGIVSFGAKTPGAPKCQFEVDVSKLRDPSGQKQFGGRNGSEPPVVKWVSEDPRIAGIVASCRLIAEDLCATRKRTGSDGKTVESGPLTHWLSIGFKDYHGRWIAPAVAEYVAAALEGDGFPVSVNHLGLQKKGTTRAL